MGPNSKGTGKGHRGTLAPKGKCQCLGVWDDQPSRKQILLGKVEST